jgi:hypothetical protein
VRDPAYAPVFDEPSIFEPKLTSSYSETNELSLIPNEENVLERENQGNERSKSLPALVDTLTVCEVPLVVVATLLASTGLV